MAETTDDVEDLGRKNLSSLAKAAAVGVLCLLAIVMVQQVRRYLNSMGRSHAAQS